MAWVMLRRSSMKTEMKVSFIVIAIGLSVQTAVFAAPAINPSEVQDPQRQSQSAQMLTIGVNSGRQIEFRVVGHKTMNIDFSEKDVSASLHIGPRQWILAPKKSRDGNFSIEIPEEAQATPGSEINLRLRLPEKQ